MLKKFYLYYLILGIPKFYIFSLVLILRKLFDKNQSLDFFYRKKFHLQFLFLFIFLTIEFFKFIFFENFDREYINYFYIYLVLLFSLTYFQNYNINKSETIDFIFSIFMFYSLYIFSIIVMNNVFLNCYISKAGYFDLFQLVNDEFVFFNLENYNCVKNNPYSLFSHITSYQFKVSLLGFLGFIIILNTINKIYIFFSLSIILFCQIFLFELGSRGLFFLLQLMNLTIIFYFIRKKKIKIFLLYFFSVIILSLIILKNYEKNFANIFFPDEHKYSIKFLKNSNYDYKYWYSEDLYEKYLHFQKSKLRFDEYNYLLKKKNLTAKELGLLKEMESLKFFSKDNQYKSYFYSDRFKEYKLFFDFALNKIELDQILKEKRFFHNYLMNLIVIFGFSTVYLIIFYFFFFLPFLLSFFNYKNSKLENKLTSILVLMTTLYYFNLDAYFNVLNNFLILFTLLCFLIKNLLYYE